MEGENGSDCATEQQGDAEMKLALVFAAMAFMLAMFTGCETFLSDGDTSPTNTDVLDDFGGFTTGDEPPGFGDAQLLSTYQDEEPFDDAMADHPDVRDANGHAGAKHYALRIVWGNLDHPDTAISPGEDCPITDWSGSVEVDGGVIVVKRLIRFDRGDYVVRPRKGPSKVEWVSHTMDHIDGMVFKIIDTPGPRPDSATNTVRISTPFYAGDISLDDLRDYRELVTYDECNKISIVATEIDPHACPRGFLEGIWVAETDTSGYFGGIWIGNDGEMVGHVRGRYGIRGGERVLFGKWITRSGDFGGLLRGVWMPLEREGGPDGYFEGRWVDETFTVRGFFKGHYCIREQVGDGFFHGRWVKEC